MFDKLKGLLATKAAKQAKEFIGRGQFGAVYAETPGVVRKHILEEDVKNVLNESNLQAIAADLNIAPRINEVTITPSGPNAGGTILMQDLRKNYVPLGVDEAVTALLRGEPDWTGGEWAQRNIQPNKELSKTQYQMAQVDTHKQLAQLALNDVMLQDRHAQNIFVNKLSNRPMQIDFGHAMKLTTPSQKAGALAFHVGNGLAAAGLQEEASLFTSLVNEVGQFNFNSGAYENPEAALDMAKQGLSRLQKIKGPQIEQIAAVQQKILETKRVEPVSMQSQQRLNTWGEPIERGYYGSLG